MTGMVRRMGRMIGIVLCIGLAGGMTAVAQDAPAAPDAPDATLAQPAITPSAAYKEVAKFCVADAARFCAPVDQSPDFPRGQAICLRPYRVDLTRSCRLALDAVKAATEAPQ